MWVEVRRQVGNPARSVELDDDGPIVEPGGDLDGQGVDAVELGVDGDRERDVSEPGRGCAPAVCDGVQASGGEVAGGDGRVGALEVAPG